MGQGSRAWRSYERRGYASGHCIKKIRERLEVKAKENLVEFLRKYLEIKFETHLPLKEKLINTNGKLLINSSQSWTIYCMLSLPRSPKTFRLTI